MNSISYLIRSFVNKRKTENFTAAITSAVSDTVNTNPEIVTYGLVSSALVFIFGFLYCYGAARLSYNYNLYTNNKEFAILWAILCFFFPATYYPFYAIFLDPVSALPKSATIGGKKRN